MNPKRPLMLRLVPIALAGVVLVGTGHVAWSAPAASATPAAPSMPMLVIGVVTVDGDSLKLGDIFLNAGSAASSVIGEAPQPGRQLVLDASTLFRLAQSHGLAWKPATAQERVVIERRTRSVPVSEICEQISAALSARGTDMTDTELELTSALSDLAVPIESDLKVEAVATQGSGANTRFSAVLIVTSRNQVLQRLTVAGHLERTVSIPVPMRIIGRGDVIGPDDIELRRFSAGRVPVNAIGNDVELIGLQAKRSLQAGAPVRTNDVSRATLVERGALVMLIFGGGPLQLTARGRALDEGGDGETIRVTNVDSHRVIEGVIVAPGVVTVSSTSSRLEARR